MMPYLHAALWLAYYPQPTRLHGGIYGMVQSDLLLP